MAFLVDLEKRSGKEEEDHLKRSHAKKPIWQTSLRVANNEFGLKYLRVIRSAA
jgi:hypothetical protein